MKIHAYAVALAAALVLAACGGGGGEPAGVSVPQGVRSVAASSGSDVNAGNYAGFAGPLARAVLRSTDADVPVVAGGRESPQALSGLARWALNAATPDRERALAITSSVVNCTYGGSIAITFNDADNNQIVSGGDVLTAVLSNCIVEFGTPAGSGTMAMTFNAVELNTANEPTAMDMTVSLNGFAEAGFGAMSGSFRMWMKEESATSTRLRISYQGAAVTDAGATLVYDFDVYGVFGPTGGSFDLNGGIRIGGQTYTIEGGDVFSYSGSADPSMGSITLRDAAGDRLVLRARSSTTVDLEFYPAGASAPSVSVTGVTWTSLR